MNMDDIFSHFGDIFGGAFGGGFGGGGGGRQNRGSNLRVKVRLDLEEIAKGSEKKIRLKRYMPAEGVTYKTCTACKGQGQVRRVSNTILGQMATTTTCPTCHGSGQQIKSKPRDADEHGLKREEEVVSIDIPAGVEEGMQLRVSGKGNAGPFGGIPGDLLPREVDPDRVVDAGCDLLGERRLQVRDLGSDTPATDLVGSDVATEAQGVAPQGQVPLEAREAQLTEGLDLVSLNRRLEEGIGPTPTAHDLAGRSVAEANPGMVGPAPVQLFEAPCASRTILEHARLGGDVLEHRGQVFNRIHVDDIAGAVLHCMGQPPAQQPALVNVVDNRPAPSSELLGYAAHLLDCKLPDYQPFERIAADLSPMALSFWRDNRRVSNRRLTQELGYQLRYPSYREGLKACLNEEAAAPD